MKLLAVDGNSIVNRAYYGIRLLSTKDGIYTNAIMGFLNMLLKIQEEVQPDAVAIAFDMRAPTFRHKMYADYKAGRKGMPEELAQQMPLLKELLPALGYTIIEKEGWEADDLLGTFAKSCRASGDECVIATGDRDSFQLIGDGVTVRLAFTKGGQPQGEIIDEVAIQEKYGVTPSQLIDVKALMGDASDNIPGVAGVGEKTALSLIQNFHSLDAIYENIETIDIRPSVRKKLVEGKAQAYLSRDLGKIDCDAPIDSKIETYLLREPDNQVAYPLMAKLELFALMERLGVYPEQELGALEEPPSLSLVEVTINEVPPNLGGERPLPVLFQMEEKEITALCIMEELHFYYLDENVEELALQILQSDTPKYTNHLKDLWHWVMARNSTIEQVEVDVELAAYILNPNSSDYSIQRLYGEYGIVTPVIPNGLEETYPLLQEAVGFLPLCNRLLEEIKANDQLSLLQDMEIPLAEALADMERVGIAVDRQGIIDFGEKLDVTLGEVETRIYEYAGETFNINSPKQLGEILFDPDKLGLPPKKKTKTGYSTNADVLESLKHEHPIITDILEYRQLAKLKSTYVDGLLAEVGEDGRIHTTFQQTLTRTGRISSTEPNLQNIPIRTPLGSELRRFFVAQEGTIFLDADYSQIELRVLAHLAEDEHMIDAFRKEQDIHQRTAAQVFHMPQDKVTPLMRSRAKAVNFGIVYGIGAFSLSQDIGVSIGEADDYIKGYLSYYSGVRDYMAHIIEVATEQGYVSTMFQRRRYLPELSSSRRQLREFGKRVALNMPIQGTAADIIKIAMIKVYQRLKKEQMKSRLVLQVHDELIVEAPPEEQEKAAKILQEEMEHATSLSVPLVAEVNQGKNWLDVK